MRVSLRFCEGLEERGRALRELCIEIARGNVGGARFNELLIQSGIVLDELEWDQANRLLGKSEEMLSLVDPSPPLC